METRAFSELFPLFNTASPETLEWLLSIATEEEYAEKTTIVTEDSWGKAFFLIVSGWVKIQRQIDDHKITQEILGRGDFFGEVAILDDSPRGTSVIAISHVELLTISAQRFIQTLLKEPQVQHKLLQSTVHRLHKLQNRFYRRMQPPVSRLSKVLVSLAENYGQPTEQGIEIYQISEKDLADVAETTLAETINILENIQTKGLLIIDAEQQTICLTNPKQLIHLIRTQSE
ncbi:Crp/Fnr family transcriptional regulator [Gloeocapsa sp. PCC 73106]|uniref:Crp/Fnr family transcriptional regulator n=1 Tax=Gloeocapsa sp. PCC 73106 TaxID=102232 RepID=UPI0002AD07DD|nr:Crp/Fnr family transcriptional regulator [Gloeocapsa sp. PCC 73106]ELR99380.1 cAMP-binding protein [Gloeocapsa sp. PCC 73106]